MAEQARGVTPVESTVTLVESEDDNAQQVFGDPHVVHTGLVQEMPHHTAGSVKFVGPPVRYSKAENRARLPPPTLGEHTQQVLQEILGYSQEKIQQLRAVKAIQ